jgi:3-oxoacyl-[acyl-carrier-protein] synthase III
MKDQVAIVGIGTTGYARDLGRTAPTLAIEAGSAAIKDAGLRPSDINGVCSSTWNLNPSSMYMQVTLGIPEST